MVGAQLLCPLLAVLLGPPSARPDGDLDEARRLYTLSERAMAGGEPARAVPLLRRAIVELPATADHDRMRHRLILRLGYELMAAWERTGARAYLDEAQALLTRYAAKHEALFGDTARARTERGEIYEQLYEVERRVAPPRQRDTADDGAPATTDDAGTDTDTRGMHRVVRVRTRKWKRTSHDDARVHEWISGPITDTETGLVMTMPTLQPLDPPRAFVRIAGPIRAERSARRFRREEHARARAVVKAVRPALRACFADAFARAPRDVVHTVVALELDRRGRVRAADVVGDPVIDGAGSMCVERRLADAHVAGSDRVTTRMQVPLVFFWEDGRMIDEANGVIVRDHWDTYQRRRELNHGAAGPMGSIESFSPH